MKHKTDEASRPGIPEVVLALAIIAMPIIIFYIIIHFYGPAWDITVRELLGRTMLDFFTGKISARSAFAGEFANNLHYYFEPYREPLSTPIFALLLLLFQKPVLPYMILTYLFFIYAVYKLAKELKLSTIMMLAVVVNSYMLYFLFVPNGGEGLSIALVLLGLVYLMRKRPVSGLLFGLAGLAKYPSLAIIPLVLLLDNWRDRLMALSLAAIPILAWGGIDYLLYGIPFYSFFSSIGASGVTGGLSTISLLAVFEVLAYPAVFGCLAALLLAYGGRLKLKWDYRTKIFLAFAILAAVSYAFILPHNDPFTQERYGYLLATALLIPASMMMEHAAKNWHWLRYAVPTAGLAVLLFVAYSTYSAGNNGAVMYYNPSSPVNIYAAAGTALQGVGFGSCRFVSNAWIPMIYSGYDAYSPFIMYSNKVITPLTQRLLDQTGLQNSGISVNSIIESETYRNITAYDEYILEESQYPIVVFNHTGVSASFIVNLDSSKQVYWNQNFTIYVPNNASCYSKGV